ncbi:hypothetical protein GQ473_05940 [archaeon]|nr:hypothetical protein [archaeon]
MTFQLKERKKETKPVKFNWNQKAKELLDSLSFKKKELTITEQKEQKEKKQEKERKLQRRAKLFYSYFPKKYRDFIEVEARYAGLKEVPAKLLYYNSMFFIITSIANILYLLLFFSVPLWMVFIPSVVLLTAGAIAPYVIFTILSESRKKRMEAVLPDILMLASSNIKSGLTIDRAILFAARPEFGELGLEFKKVAFEIYGGNDLEQAFRKLTTRIKSSILERTINLLLEGLRSGGAVAKLLEETATDIKNTEMLQREIRSSVMMYTIFIFMAAVLGAPALFAISNFLITSSSSMWDDQIGSGMEDVPNTGFLTISAPQMNLESFEYFSIVTIIITTFFSGILISLIQTGKIRNSVKYIPIFMSVSIVLFFVIKTVLFSVFGDMLGLT